VDHSQLGVIVGPAVAAMLTLQPRSDLVARDWVRTARKTHTSSTQQRKVVAYPITKATSRDGKVHLRRGLGR
jgi:hypothetical protein